MLGQIKHAIALMHQAQLSDKRPVAEQTQLIQSMMRAIELMSKMIDCPNRWPRTRLIWNFGFLSLWMRRQYRPHYRWMKKDRSLLVFGCLGVVGMLTTTPWLVALGDRIENSNTVQGLKLWYLMLSQRR